MFSRKAIFLTVGHTYCSFNFRLSTLVPNLSCIENKVLNSDRPCTTARCQMSRFCQFYPRVCIFLHCLNLHHSCFCKRKRQINHSDQKSRPLHKLPNMESLSCGSQLRPQQICRATLRATQLGRFVFWPQIMVICHHQARKYSFPMMQASILVAKGKQAKITVLICKLQLCRNHTIYIVHMTGRDSVHELIMQFDPPVGRPNQWTWSSQKNLDTNWIRIVLHYVNPMKDKSHLKISLPVQLHLV